MGEYPAWETVALRGQEFAVVECGTCGVVHVVPLTMQKAMWDSGGYAHCPNGHSRGWTEGHTDREAVRRERDRLKQENARLEEEARVAWRTANEQVAERGKVERELKRVNTRIGAGVCPCCNRTFRQLSRHMQSKHPDVPFVPAKKAGRGQ